MTVTFDNLGPVGRLMRVMPREIERDFGAGVRELLEPVKRTAQANIRAGVSPSSTGTLQRSIRIGVSRRGRRIGGRLGTKLVYAPVREFAKRRVLRIPGRAPAVQTLTPGRFVMRAVESRRRDVELRASALISRTVQRMVREAGLPPGVV